MSTPTLSEFLLARIAEDEGFARAVHANRCDTPAETTLDTMGRPLSPTCGCDWHITRVLAECEAKRLIVYFHPMDENHECLGCDCVDPCPTLRAIALPYADHTDYDEEWRP